MSSNEELTSITRTSSRAQFFIFNLFADYIVPYGDGAAWTNDLLRLLGLLGLSEPAARTTLSRMKQQGWFVSERFGRHSRYRLTEPGRAIIREGDERIFEPSLSEWDGRWQLIVYSLPESKRALRNELRKKLVWFGFGKLAPGTWITPHDRRRELSLIVASLDVSEHVSLFSAENAGLMDDAALVQRCWDVAALSAAYESFIARWQPELERLQRLNETESMAFPLETRFYQRFMLTFDFQPFPRQDPNLPLELLPGDWPGQTARALFSDLRDQLVTGLPAYFEQLLQADSVSLTATI